MKKYLKKKYAVAFIMALLLMTSTKAFADSGRFSNILNSIRNAFSTTTEHYMGSINKETNKLEAEKSQDIKDYIDAASKQAVTDLDAYINSELGKAENEIDSYINDFKGQMDSVISDEKANLKAKISEKINKDVDKIKADLNKDIEKYLKDSFK